LEKEKAQEKAEEEMKKVKDQAEAEKKK